MATEPLEDVRAVDRVKIQELLASVAAGDLSPDDASERLKTLPYEDLGFAKVDHHRSLRRGVPETILAAGKTPQQVVEIVSRMRAHGSSVLATRCKPEDISAVQAVHPDSVHHELARCLTISDTPPETLDGFVAVMCAGTADLPVAEEAAVTCTFMGNRVKRINDVGVAGLHRLLEQREAFKGANALIVCAGMEGALPTAVAGLVDRPVIAVPTSVGYGASFGGIAALLGMLNSCAEGVTVVNIDNGFGAAVSATIINRLANGKCS